MTILSSINIRPDGAFTTLLDLIYPIGSFYASTSPTSPSSLFGGTWSLFKEGVYPMSAGSTYKPTSTGGSNTVTLTTSQIPAHNHSGSAASAGAHTHTLGNAQRRGMAVGAVYLDSGVQPSGAFATNVNTIGGSRTVPGFTNVSGIHGYGLTVSDSAGAHTHTVSTNNTGGGGRTPICQRIMRFICGCGLLKFYMGGGTVACR